METTTKCRCSGFLFNGSSHLVRFTLNEAERRQLDQITEAMENEFTVPTAAGRNAAYPAEAFHHPMHPNRPSATGYHARKGIRLRDCPPVLQSGRRALPDQKQVQDYADMLHKSPKTLSNIFSTCKLPSPLRVIHERVEAEAKRLLLYSNKSAKEIADILGFEDQASFSRFFKNMTGQSAVQFRNTEVGKN